MPTGLGPKFSALVTPPLTEGPALFRRDTRWVMLFDHFIGGVFGAVESEDGRSWLAITEQLQLPPGVRHASVLTIDAAHAAHLLHWLA